MAHKITTTFIFTGERAVKVDGKYAGTIVREKDGWRWMGNPRKFRTFTEAAQDVGARFLRRKEADRVREVTPGDAVILRSKTDGIETWHRVQQVIVRPNHRWAMYVGGLSVRYTSDDYEFVRPAVPGEAFAM